MNAFNLIRWKGMTKQERNREAAHNFRLRQKEYVKKLEQEVEDLKNGKMDYQFKIALLQSENCCLKSHIDCVRTAYEMLTGQKIESQNVKMMSREQSQIKLEHNTELNEEQYQQQEYIQSDQGVYQFQPQIESFATDSPSFNKSEPFSGQLSENHQSCFEPLVPLGGSPLFPLSVTSWSASSQSSHSSLAEQNGSAKCNGMQAVCNAAPSVQNEALSL